MTERPPYEDDALVAKHENNQGGCSAHKCPGHMAAPNSVFFLSFFLTTNRTINEKSIQNFDKNCFLHFTERVLDLLLRSLEREREEDLRITNQICQEDHCLCK
jgi:hypothetical protein